MVRFEHLCKKYGRQYALKDFSAELESGIYGLLGTNGAGKTTLLNTFMGILPSDGGHIYIDDRDVTTMGADFLNDIGYLPQYPRFYKDFTVSEFMRYMCVLKDMSGNGAKERVAYLLNTVNLEDSADKKIGALSGGMRQRLGIAQAMLSNPKVLILDEPTAGLDPMERIRFRNLITTFSAERIVILATHIVSDVEFIADKILLLHKGELLRFDTPQALCEELAGKVWALALNTPDVPGELLHHTISAMTREQDGIHLRILCETSPHPQASAVPARLEEVFLYHCGGESL